MKDSSAVFGDEAFHEGVRAAGGEEDLFLDFEMVDEFEFVAIDGAPGKFGDVSGGRVGGERAAREDAE